MSETIQQLFDPERFRTLAYEMTDLLADYLSQLQKGQLHVNEWKNHDDLFKTWRSFLSESPSFKEISSKIIADSIHLHHPHYVGHQVAVPLPEVAAIDMLVSFLNNGMGVYEMGSAGTIVEKLVIERMCQAFELNDGSGFFTSGGTLANLTVMLAARQSKAEDDIWEKGSRKKLGLLVSDQAHYCIDRAARIMGWGSEGVIKIPVNEDYRMNTDLIPEYTEKAKQNNIKLVAIVGSAPSTSTGIYDDLESIAAYAKRYNLWFHVDAAHGGAAIFSGEYKNLLEGAQQADSIIIDTHKMMLTSALATGVLFKSATQSFSAFRTRAQYLWEDSHEEDWENLAKRTFECTKQMMALRAFFLFELYGPELFSNHINYLFDLARHFHACIDRESNFENFRKPDSNIVCFRWKDDSRTIEEINIINKELRKAVLEEGQFYIVQTILDQNAWLRVSLMNPMTSEDHLEDLIEYLKQKINKILSKDVT